MPTFCILFIFRILRHHRLTLQIAALREEVQSRARNHVTHHSGDTSDTPDYQEFLSIKRRLEKEIENLKVRLTVHEQDKMKSESRITVLESQVKRYRTQAQEAVSYSPHCLFQTKFHTTIDCDVSYRVSHCCRVSH